VVDLRAVLGTVPRSAFAGEHLHAEVLVLTSLIYLCAGTWLLISHRGEFRSLLRDGFRTPYAEMAEPDDVVAAP
jgi:hypothetical protein